MEQSQMDNEENIKKTVKIVQEACTLCEEIIINMSNENFKDDDERIQFIISTAMNLLGNIVIDLSKDTKKSMVANTNYIMEQMSSFFNHAIKYKENSKSK